MTYVHFHFILFFVYKFYCVLRALSKLNFLCFFFRNHFFYLLYFYTPFSTLITQLPFFLLPLNFFLFLPSYFLSPFFFSSCGLNSQRDEEHTSTALGYAVHILILVSKYLDVRTHLRHTCLSCFYGIP